MRKSLDVTILAVLAVALIMFPPFIFTCQDSYGQEIDKKKQHRNYWNRKRPEIEFNKKVSIGDPIRTDCTVRCHIDFPFSKEKNKFHHSSHSPRKGFKCVLCHDSTELPDPNHGKLKLTQNDCFSCHHLEKRFSSCKLCHKPVNKKVIIMNMSFDHMKHSSSTATISCEDCHLRIDHTDRLKDSLTCLPCHHVEPAPTGCKSCHENAYVPKMSDKYEGFNHGMHVKSEYMDDGCWSCHVKDYKFSKPTEMACAKCHHSTKQGIGPKCVVCHEIDTITVSNQKRDNLPFSHKNHASANLECNECHDTDERCSPAKGADCGRCHHQVDDGCRKCHTLKLYFNKKFPNSTGGRKLTFQHSVHEQNLNCTICHPKGENIRHGMSSINCADCHHHSGHGPTCVNCHSIIEEIRAGRIPGMEKGNADPMYGIVSCKECHLFSASYHRSLSDGRQSCSRCHTEDYTQILSQMREILHNELNEVEMKSDGKESLFTISQGMHNFHLSVDVLKRLNKSLSK